jgi:hypothetical protein
MGNQAKSILDLPFAEVAQDAPAVITRKRIKCIFCGGFAFVAQNTPDAERQACRYCRHLGLFEATKS